jgi:hypothetical protein
MYKGNPPPSRPYAWDLVYKTVPPRSAGFECRIKIWHPITDVVNAGAPLGQEPPDGAVRMLRRQQLHFGVAEGEGKDGCPVYFLGGMGLESQDVAVESQRRIQIGHGNADMSNEGTVSH